VRRPRGQGQRWSRQNRFAIGQRLGHRHHHVGEGHASDDVDLVALDELADDLHAQLWLELIVFFEHFNRGTPKLAARLFDAQHETVVHVLAQRGCGA